MSRNIVLAIDYDGTWTRDPVFFREMVERAKAKGHTCVLVTGRSDEAQWGAEVRREIGDLMPILFCANKWKRPILDAWLVDRRMAGAHVVSVDDSPEYFAEQDPRRCVNR